MITTILGAIFGVICILLLKNDVSFWPIGVSALINHTVMGFAIGVSSLKVHWAPHGILWGFLFGIFLAVGWWGGPPGFWWALGFVIIWGFLIELITVVGFKMRVEK